MDGTVPHGDLIASVIQQGKRAIDALNKAEHSERNDYNKRDVEAVYEELDEDQSSRRQHRGGDKKDLSQKYNKANQLRWEAWGELEQLQLTARGECDDLMEALTHLSDAFKSSMVQVPRQAFGDFELLLYEDIRAMMSYIFQPDYQQAESDWYESIGYRIQQIVDTLQGMLTPEGFTYRVKLLNQAKDDQSYYGYFGKPTKALEMRYDYGLFNKAESEAMSTAEQTQSVWDSPPELFPFED